MSSEIASRFAQSSHWILALALSSFCTTIASAQKSPGTRLPRDNQTGQTAPVFRQYMCGKHAAVRVEKLIKEILPQRHDAVLVVDPRTNSILVQGSNQVQTTVEQFIRSLQTVDGDAKSAPAVVRAYALPLSDQKNAVARIRARYDGDSAVRITFDQTSGRLFALAPVPIHREIASALEKPFVSKQNPTDLKTPTVRRFVPLPPARHPDIRHRILRLFSSRLQSTRDLNRDLFQIPFRSGLVTLEFNPAKGGLFIAGAPRAARQFQTLVAAVVALQTPSQQVRILLVERAAPGQLRKAFDAYRGVPPEPDPHDGSAIDRRLPTGPERNPAITPAAYLAPDAFAPEPQQAGQTQPPTAATPPNSDEDEDTEPLPELENVEVEALDDLDVLILRGREQDVQDLARMIRALDRISAETQPEITVYQLRHTQSSAMANVIGTVDNDLVSTRQGRVEVTPLVKPNALLVIGWGDAVQAMLELIGKLDRPVPAETQFSVFRLQYAPAANAQQVITSFFSSRGGLSPQVQVIADPRTNAIIVYAAPRDMQEVSRLVAQLDRAQGAAVNRARIFTVEHALAADLASTLEDALQAATSASSSSRNAVLELLTTSPDGERLVRSGMLNQVEITPNVRNNSLIVSAPLESMDLIAALIEQLDTPVARAQLKVFRVANGDAASLVQTLRSLLPTQSGTTFSTQLSSAPDEPSLVPLRFSVDARSNSIIATGSEGDLKIVEALLLRLDEKEASSRKSEVYQLKNAPAVDVAAAIGQFLRSQQLLQQAAPGAENVAQLIEREVVVVPEPVSNKLILSATPRFFLIVKELIEKLDEPAPQVMIQVLIAEVTLGTSDEFGVELGLQDSVLFDRSLLGELVTTTQTTNTQSAGGAITTVTGDTIQSATNTPGFNFASPLPLGNSGGSLSLNGSRQLGTQGFSNFTIGRTNAELGFGGLVFAASSRNINILLRALQESRRLDVLSRPQIRTLDNQSAFIQVGQRVPRIMGSTVNQNGQSNTVALENVGLIIGVTPRISPDGMVVMEIDAEKSALGPEQEGVPVSVSVDGTVIRAPRIDTTTAQATVSAASGETIVLGGLITKRRQEITRRVPLLGDLPLLRHLFRFDSQGEQRAELLIILTPKVIRTPEEGEQIKQTEMARMSWCAADVYDLHGDIGLHFRETTISEEGTEVIYPDFDPRGQPLDAPAEEEPVPVTLGPLDTTPDNAQYPPARGVQTARYAGTTNRSQPGVLRLPLPTTNRDTPVPMRTVQSPIDQAASRQDTP
ncbi:MAG: secretin N-terminal domain-containing protein [Planctomycetota bacterium]|nr:secretin N-terminal domain-containing protein [Planctomycetota bacterium]